MKRMLIPALIALMACLAVGVAFADGNNPADDSTDNPERNYGHYDAPGVPENIGPDDHQNTHRGERGGKYETPTIDSLNQFPILIILPYVLW